VIEVDMPGATQGGDHRGSLRNVGLVMGAGAAQQCPGALQKSERQVCTMGRSGFRVVTQRGSTCRTFSGPGARMMWPRRGS
jgi:hypothetical protein